MRVASRRAFSLLEVVLAIAIFGLAVIALVGLSGPLMRRMAEAQESAALEPVVAVTRSWVETQARLDFAALRATLESDPVRYAYRLEPLDGDAAATAAGWHLGDSADLSALAAVGDVPMILGDGTVFVVQLHVETPSAGNASTTYLRARADVAEAPAPEPGGDFAAWETRAATQPHIHSFRLVALP